MLNKKSDSWKDSIILKMEKEININGQKYFSQEKYDNDLKEIKEKLEFLMNQPERKLPIRAGGKHFPLNTSLKLCKMFDRIFTEACEPINEEWAVKNGVNIIDPAHICMCIGVSEEAKRFLSKFKESDSEDKPEPVLDYLSKDNVISSNFSAGYIKKIIDIIDFESEKVFFCLNKDYPITIYNEHFKFILAPRIED